MKWENYKYKNLESWKNEKKFEKLNNEIITIEKNMVNKIWKIEEWEMGKNII